MPAIEPPTPDRLIEILRENDAAGDILCGHAADEIERLLQLVSRAADKMKQLAEENERLRALFEIPAGMKV